MKCAQPTSNGAVCPGDGSAVQRSFSEEAAERGGLADRHLNPQPEHYHLTREMLCNLLLPQARFEENYYMFSIVL